MTRRPYIATGRPVISPRLADEGAAFLAALPPKPFPWTMVGIWGPMIALWGAAAALAYLPAWMGY